MSHKNDAKNMGRSADKAPLLVDKVARREEQQREKAREKKPVKTAKAKDKFEAQAAPPAAKRQIQDQLIQGDRRASQQNLIGRNVTARADLPLTPIARKVTADPPPRPTMDQNLAKKIVGLAEQRVAKQRRGYAFAGPWLSPNPNIFANAAPDKKTVPGSHEQHKDGYLCLDILYLSGFAVPTVKIEHDEAGFWYPPVLEWPEFAKNRERLFNIVAVERMHGLGHKVRLRHLEKFLPNAQPGDLLVGEFIAGDGDPYGLSWLIIDNLMAGEKLLVAASAGQGGALIADYPHSHFLWAETLHILRPARLRHDGDTTDSGLHAPAKRFR